MEFIHGERPAGGRKRPVRLRRGVGPSGERLSWSPSPPRNSLPRKRPGDPVTGSRCLLAAVGGRNG